MVSGVMTSEALAGGANEPGRKRTTGSCRPKDAWGVTVVGAVAEVDRRKVSKLL